jgi:hypothetical protein
MNSAKPSPVKMLKSKQPAKRKYEDLEAECSDGSADEEEGADEYDMKMDMMKRDSESESEGDEDAVTALRMKQALEPTSSKAKTSGKAFSARASKMEKAEPPKTMQLASGNKRLNHPIPSEPTVKEEVKLPPHMRWCLRLDPKSFRRAVRPALKALPMCFFRFDITQVDGETNAGLTIQAFDNPATMGYYSRVRMNIIPGVDENNKKLSLMDLHNSNFGLTSKNLETVIIVASASNPSATLQFMMFNTNEDKLTVKSVADGSTMMSTFNVNLLKKSSTDSPIPGLMLKAAKEKEERKRLVFRITAQLLRQQGDVAKRIGSEDLRFDVFRAKGEDSEAVRYRLSVIWSGSEIDGQQDSFVGTVKRQVGGIVQMEPMVDDWGKSSIEWLPVSSQAYSANKFTMFLCNMDTEWLNLSIGTNIDKSQNLPLELYSDDGLCEDVKQYLTIAAMEDDD